MKVTKHSLEKKNKVEELKLPDFEAYQRPTVVIKAVWLVLT